MDNWKICVVQFKLSTLSSCWKLKNVLVSLSRRSILFGLLVVWVDTQKEVQAYNCPCLFGSDFPFCFWLIVKSILQKYHYHVDALQKYECLSQPCERDRCTGVSQLKIVAYNLVCQILTLLLSMVAKFFHAFQFKNIKTELIPSLGWILSQDTRLNSNTKGPPCLHLSLSIISHLANVSLN